MENTIDNGRIVIHTVDFRGDASGQSSETHLAMPVVLEGIQVSPFALCRMCAGRLALPLLARMLVTLVLDAEEVGLPFRYAYDDLGLEFSRCGHSVKAAAAMLRKAGLLSTARAGSTGEVTFSAGPFVMWATDVLRKSGLIDWQPAYRPEPQLAFVPPPVSLVDAFVSKPGEAVPENGKSVSKTGESVSKTPKRVSKTRKPRTQPEQPVVKKEGLGTSLEEQLREAREQEVAAFRQEDGSLYPGVWLDSEGRPHFDASSGHPVPPCLQAAGGEDVDPSGEIAGTLRAAGRTAERTADADEDEFSLGSDTAETDMGHGVKINPDI